MGKGRESGISQRPMDERGKSMKPNSYSTLCSFVKIDLQILSCIVLRKRREIFDFYLYINLSVEFTVDFNSIFEIKIEIKKILCFA